MKNVVTTRLGLVRTFAMTTLAVVGIVATPAVAEAPVALMPHSSINVALGGVAATALTDITPPLSAAEAEFETIGKGMASYYGRELAGNRTASGERFNPTDLTAAHRTLPFGSKVRVTNARTGASVVVRINDRGPFHGNRLIDLSEAAAREIGIRSAGSGTVEIALADPA